MTSEHQGVLDLFSRWDDWQLKEHKPGISTKYVMAIFPQKMVFNSKLSILNKLYSSFFTCMYTEAIGYFDPDSGLNVHAMV